MANLPYNVAVPVIVRVLEEAGAVASLLVMVQREVGERLAAVPGTKAYGAVSVKVAYYATARLVGRVPAAVFVPRPRWSRSSYGWSRREVVAVDPAVVAPDRLFAVVRAGFAQRRKMLRRLLVRCGRSGRLRRRRRQPAGAGRRVVDRGLGTAGGVPGQPGR